MFVSTGSNCGEVVGGEVGACVRWALPAVAPVTVLPSMVGHCSGSALAFGVAAFGSALPFGLVLPALGGAGAGGAAGAWAQATTVEARLEGHDLSSTRTTAIPSTTMVSAATT